MKNLILSLFVFLTACTSGNCRSQKANAPQTPEEKALSGTPLTTANVTRHVKIYKYDGSLQCAMGKPIPLSQMQKELTGITIFSSENKPDGLMHIQTCGTPTGRANVFEIDKAQLDAAKLKSFREWTFE